MKKYILSCFLILSCSFLHAQDNKAIIKVMNTQQAAWNRGDIEGFMQGYWKSDSLLFVGRALMHGWQATLNNYKKNYPDKKAMGVLSLEILKIQSIDPQNALIVGDWHIKREWDTEGGYFTLWFRKINGEWKIVCDHSS